MTLFDTCRIWGCEASRYAENAETANAWSSTLLFPEINLRSHQERNRQLRWRSDGTANPVMKKGPPTPLEQ